VLPDVLAQLAIRENGPVYALVDQSLEGVGPELVIVEHVREDLSLHVRGFYLMLANVGRFSLDLRKKLSGVGPVYVRSELIGVDFREADDIVLALFPAIGRDRCLEELRLLADGDLLHFELVLVFVGADQDLDQVVVAVIMAMDLVSCVYTRILDACFGLTGHA
jgi:hypothetical protein